MNSKLQIGGQVVRISVRPVASAFGVLYQASNDLGEPRNQVKAYRSAKAALAAEIAELKALLE